MVRVFFAKWGGTTRDIKGTTRDTGGTTPDEVPQETFRGTTPATFSMCPLWYRYHKTVFPGGLFAFSDFFWAAFFRRNFLRDFFGKFFFGIVGKFLRVALLNKQTNVHGQCDLVLERRLVLEPHTRALQGQNYPRSCAARSRARAAAHRFDFALACARRMLLVLESIDQINCSMCASRFALAQQFDCATIWLRDASTNKNFACSRDIPLSSRKKRDTCR